MTESKDPAPSAVAVRDTVTERVPGSEGEHSPSKDQAERKPSKFLQKLRGTDSSDVEISSQGGSEESEDSFKMSGLQEAVENIASTPKAARGLAALSSSAQKRLGASGGLGTVSFYNNSTNVRSPAHPIFSPSQGRIVVDVEGQAVPYEQWYRHMSRRTPLKPLPNNPVTNSDNTAKTLSFGSEEAPPAAPPPPDQKRCQFLQQPLSSLLPPARHTKLLRFSNSVTPTTLRNAIAKLFQVGPEAIEGLGELDRAELIQLYVSTAHGGEEGEGGEEVAEEIPEDVEAQEEEKEEEEGL